MVSECYVINLFGVDTDYYTNEYVGRCWEIAADEEYQNSKIYVTGRLNISQLICGEKRSCTLGRVGHCIVAVRNPTEAPDKEAYRKAIKHVINRTRSLLGNPNMSVVIEDVEYYFFCQV